MTFRILYFALDQKHITLKEDGSIEIYHPDFQEPILIDYKQAKILKNMILAEAELEKIERR